MAPPPLIWSNTFHACSSDVRSRRRPRRGPARPEDPAARRRRRPRRRCPACAAATCGRTRRCPPPAPAARWGMSSSASSRRPAPTCRGLKAGDLVVAPFTYCDNTCDYCRKGLHISCRHGGRYGLDGVDGGQGEAVRVPQADGTLVKLPVGADSALLPSLLTLSDVMCTGHHGAVTAGVGRGDAVAGHRRRRGRPVRGDRRQAPGRRADHPHGPPHRPHRPGPRVRRHRRRRRTRRGRHRPRSAS